MQIFYNIDKYLSGINKINLFTRYITLVNESFLLMGDTYYALLNTHFIYTHSPTNNALCIVMYFSGLCTAFLRLVRTIFVPRPPSVKTKKKKTGIMSCLLTKHM